MNARATPMLRLASCAALVAVCGLLVACASTPPPAPDTGYLLHDEYYPTARVPPERDQVFALSPAMRAYADTELHSLARLHDPRQALLDALYRQGQLRLSYDAGATRNAAEAFEARAGNCLSLVIMTAAFARHLGVPASYQSVQVDETYTRSGGLLLVSNHVNLVLGRRTPRSIFTGSQHDDMTIDFLPTEELRGQRTVPLEERTVLAMYFNNRAAEALASGRNTEAYAWAREALREDAGFSAAVNTLAVLYMRDGHLPAAEASLRHVLAAAPLSASTLSNLVLLLQREGRDAEAQAVQQQLARTQPDTPFLQLEQGQQAMARGEYAQARELFTRELRRQPDQPEVLFWLAQAEWRLGDSGRAASHLQQAMENSRTTGARQLYAGKLAWLRATQQH